MTKSLVLAFTVLALSSCSNDEPMGHGRPPAQYALLGDGIEVTGHLPLTGGGTNRLVFSILDDDKRVITNTGNLQLTLSWDPTDLATAVLVPGTTTSFDVSTSKPADTAGFMTLTLYNSDTQVTRTFEPFPVLVH